MNNISIYIKLLYSIFTKNQKVWLCVRPDFSFLFKSCEIDRSQGILVK